MRKNTKKERNNLLDFFSFEVYNKIKKLSKEKIYGFFKGI